MTMPIEPEYGARCLRRMRTNIRRTLPRRSSAAELRAQRFEVVVAVPGDGDRAGPAFVDEHDLRPERALQLHLDVAVRRRDRLRLLLRLLLLRRLRGGAPRVLDVGEQRQVRRWTARHAAAA